MKAYRISLITLKALQKCSGYKFLKSRCICIAHGNRQQCGDGQRERRFGAGRVEVGQNEGMGKSVIVSMIKTKLKNPIKFFLKNHYIVFLIQ